MPDAPTKPRTLYDITDDVMALESLLDEAGGDITDPAVCAAFDAWVAELATDMGNKVDNYAAMIRELEFRAADAKEEAARLIARAKSAESKREFLASRLQTALEMQGSPKIEGRRFTVSIVGNGGAIPLEIETEAHIPSAYFVTPAPVLSKAKLKDAIEAGMVIEGVKLGERGKRLSIR